MRTLIPDPPPPGFEELLAQRRQFGADRRDEVWEGVYHVAPSPTGEHAGICQQLALLLDEPARAAGLVAVMAEFNVGLSKHDFRIPDGGIFRTPPRGTWQHTAALVVEVLSPGDEAWEKLPFYAAREVDEIVIVDPADRSVTWLARASGEYREVERSGLIDLGPAALRELIDWP
jgi:Uma2 family endonuclease